MEKIENQSHDKEALLYLCSKTLERAAHYGIRALIVIYMVSETLNMDRSEALSIYAGFTVLMIFSRLLGGVIGDLSIGNRKSIIIGGVMQSIGAFTLCMPSTLGLYIGLFLITIGGGLYTPNILSNYGKLYLNKVKLLDSAFALDYLAITLGAFLGIMIITYCGEEYGWNTGFIIAGGLMLASVIPIVSSSEKVVNQASNSNFSISKSTLNIVCSVLLVALFWVIYEMSSIRMSAIQLELSDVSKSIVPVGVWTSFQSMIVLPILIVLIPVWTYLYSSYQFKLLLGFVFGAVGYGILIYLPEIPGEQHVITYLMSLLFLGLSEAYIAPVISSVVTKYSNPKYLAIIFGLVFIPSRILSMLLGFFNEDLYRNPSQVLVIGMTVTILTSIGLAAYIATAKKEVDTSYPLR
jgi:POT family proton-dependent oligopeptide transporter